MDSHCLIESDCPIDSVTNLVISQRRSVAKSIGCSQRRLFVCVFVGVFVCQHDNFQTSKHKMMKLGGRCIIQKSRLSSHLGS